MLAVVMLFLASTSAHGQSSIATTPYQLRVILDFGEHRVLTPTFQQRVQQQLRAFLLLHYGNLAEIEVAGKHERLAEVRLKSLQALDGWDELSPFRTCFVLVDFADGRYHLRIRQQDGFTGQVAPPRHESTSMPEEVARLAARLIDHDFGPSGTIERVEGSKVTVLLQGGELPGVQLGRWVQQGDVLLVIRREKVGDRVRPLRLEFAALVVKEAPRRSRCVCEYYHRYQQDSLEAGDSCRCLKIATVTAPLRLRFVGESAEDALEKLQVKIGKGGYDREVREVALDAAGLLRTEASYPGIAFLRVRSGAEALAELPVVLMDDRVQVIPITVKAEAVTRGQFVRQVERWELALLDELVVADTRVRRLNVLIQTSQEEALKQARAGEQHLQEMLRVFRQQGLELQQAVDRAGIVIDFTGGQQRLRELQERFDALKKFGDELEAAIRKATSPETLEAQRLLAQAALLEKQAEYQRAITLYRKVVQLRPEEKKIVDYLAQLEQQWQERGPEHQQARAFIYGTWASKLDAAGLRTHFDRVKQACAVCQKVGDRLTPRMFLLANAAHKVTLARRLEVLRQRLGSEDGRTETKAINTLVEELGRLHTEMYAFVQGKREK